MKNKTVAISYSRWRAFEMCPAMYKLNGERPGVASFGQDEHKQMELYLQGEGPLPAIPDRFRNALVDLKAQAYKPEVEFAYREDLTPCKWFDKDAAWRAKLDALLVEPGNRVATYVDHKFGKIQVTGWREQLEMGAVSIMLRHPWVTIVECQLWWIRHDHICRDKLFRWELEDLIAKWMHRYVTLNVTAEFPRHPSGLCRSCRHYVMNEGPCDGSPEEVKR